MKSISFFIQEILALLSAEKRPLNHKQIASHLGLKDKASRKQLLKILDDLAFKGKIEFVDRGRYRYKKQEFIIEGKIETIKSGAGFVVSEAMENDVFIPQRYLAGAYNGDQVRVRVTSQFSDQKPEGEVLEVLERHKSYFTGLIQLSKNFAFVIPDDFKFGQDIFIPLKKINGAKSGEKVGVEIVKWPRKKDESPEGKVIEVIGKAGEKNTEIHAILAEFGLPRGFPERLEKEAAKIPLDISPQEIKRRRDFRDTLTFTIDPFDAKDFDDAISFKALENELYEIGVHIADVTHYVKPGSLIDKEAVERATSIYLVDRVIPMLPEVLSNVVCSLRPNEDKLVFSAVFTLDINGTIKKQWLGKSIIHSRRRYTYEEAQEIIQTQKGDYAKEIGIVDKIAKAIRKKRMQHGAISFDREEVRFKLEGDRPSEVVFKRSLDAHKLIEEFMLLANKKVAEFIGMPKGENRPKPFVYRIHDTPSEERVNELSSFVKTFGYSFGGKAPKEIARSMNKLLAQVKGKGEANMIETLAVRSMAKAVYTTENIGHYGLAFDYYTHFTSPIRRYPDVLVHRLLEQYLNKEKGMKPDDLEHLCTHSSDRERLASEAERASIRYMQVLYLEERVGQIFDGVISGITEWGIYVEIKENKCEGMVRLRDLEGDHYVFDQKKYSAVGKRTKKTYRLGDEVKIKIKDIDLYKKQVDFQMIG